MKTPFNLTAEQHLIVHSSVDVLLVQAFAGIVCGVWLSRWRWAV